MTFIHFYLCISSLFINSTNSNIDSLFYNWNKASLKSLKESVNQAKSVGEKELYTNYLEAQPLFWDISIDSLNNESIRWKFLEQAAKDFSWKDRNWTIIEVMKSGEIKRLQNYLIYYNGPEAIIFSYEYLSGRWIKKSERHAVFKMRDLALAKSRVPFDSGRFNYDVIVTNFKSESVLQSVFYLVTTLSDTGKIADVICKDMNKKIE